MPPVRPKVSHYGMTIETYGQAPWQGRETMPQPGFNVAAFARTWAASNETHALAKRGYRRDLRQSF
ncbi:MAG: hypothetical protein HZA46_08135 [Planctomycetales bacterium]|nr:hypothetical protein [Planctomycetales bacterium]